MEEGMSVMLRFGRRVPELEEAFKKDGHEIVLPKKNRKELDKFNVAVTSAATFDQAVTDTEEFLCKHIRGLRVYAEVGRGPSLDIGIELDNPAFFKNECLLPPSFLALLVSLNIRLCISLYT
jgi:hypothetical protein